MQASRERHTGQHKAQAKSKVEGDKQHGCMLMQVLRHVHTTPTCCPPSCILTAIPFSADMQSSFFEFNTLHLTITST